MITPQELKRREFSKSFKGYSVSEVDDYVMFVLSRYNELFHAYNELERKYSQSLIELENAKSEETAVTATIVNAQKMADAIVSDANKKASAIKGAVSESCDRILEVYRNKVAAERDKLVECEEAVTKFKNALYEAYKKHIAMIDNIMPDEEPTPYFTDEELEDKAVELASEKLEALMPEEAVSDEEQSEEVSPENDACSEAEINE